MLKVTCACLITAALIAAPLAAADKPAEPTVNFNDYKLGPDPEQSPRTFRKERSRKSIRLDHLENLSPTLGAIIGFMCRLNMRRPRRPPP